jgi:hypothetical protein
MKSWTKQQERWWNKTKKEIYKQQDRLTLPTPTADHVVVPRMWSQVAMYSVACWVYNSIFRDEVVGAHSSDFLAEKKEENSARSNNTCDMHVRSRCLDMQIDFASQQRVIGSAWPGPDGAARRTYGHGQASRSVFPATSRTAAATRVRTDCRLSILSVTASPHSTCRF